MPTWPKGSHDILLIKFGPQEPSCCKTQQKSPGQENGLGNKGSLKVLIDTNWSQLADLINEINQSQCYVKTLLYKYILCLKSTTRDILWHSRKFKDFFLPCVAAELCSFHLMYTRGFQTINLLFQRGLNFVKIYHLNA